MDAHRLVSALGALRTNSIREIACLRHGVGWTTPLLLMGLAACGGGGGGGGSSGSDVITQAKVLIEHNFTDEDTGFQGFVDGDPWNDLTIRGPGFRSIVSVQAEGGLRGFGLTELFYETSEPPNADVPISEVLGRLPPGTYQATGEMVEGSDGARTTPLTHSIPVGPPLTSPADGANGLDPDNLVVVWGPVTRDLDGLPVNVVGYQVTVTVHGAKRFPATFAHPEFSIFLPPTARSVRVPAEFMEDDTCYDWEVLAIEESGNQTLSSARFGTGVGCPVDPPEVDVPPQLTKARILIEHNATDEDTGFQGFADGDPWNLLTITGPAGRIVSVRPQGGLLDFGLTELFFETAEPENAEVPIAQVLARLPAGTYTFSGTMVDGGVSTRTATLSHQIPQGVVLTAPVNGATDVDPANAVVSWNGVTTSLDGQPVTIVGYQVIVEEDAVPVYPHGFYRPVFSATLGTSLRQVRVPAELLRAATSYKFEVLAIEASGNQTLRSATFRTR